MIRFLVIETSQLTRVPLARIESVPIPPGADEYFLGYVHGPRLIKGPAAVGVDQLPMQQVGCLERLFLALSEGLFHVVYRL